MRRPGVRSNRSKPQRDLLRVSVSKKAILDYDFADDLPAVEADSGQIRQVVMNLITNASDALGDSGGTIRVRTGSTETGDQDPSDPLTPHPPAGRYVFVEVSDNGCGMDETVRSKIFDPFFTTKFTGRGLGLAAVQGIVRGHHGAVRVDSQPGQGTTVTLLFPPSDREAPARDETRVTRGADLGGGTVLLVDDEESVLTLATAILEEAGFTVLTARNGREAVERFREKRDEFVLVLLDLTMPEMSGREALREIRRIRGDVRVILSSGYPESDAVRDCPGSGPVRFLQKPYGPPVLIEEVRRALAC
jgi:CheY-like chemotaxis protein